MTLQDLQLKYSLHFTEFRRRKGSVALDVIHKLEPNSLHAKCTKHTRLNTSQKKSRRFHLICQKGNLASNREICSLLNPHRGEMGSSPVRERETDRRLAADRSSYRKKETVSAKTKLNEKTDTACGTMFALKQSCQRGRDKSISDRFRYFH